MYNYRKNFETLTLTTKEQLKNYDDIYDNLNNMDDCYSIKVPELTKILQFIFLSHHYYVEEKHEQLLLPYMDKIYTLDEFSQAIYDMMKIFYPRSELIGYVHFKYSNSIKSFPYYLVGYDSNLNFDLLSDMLFGYDYVKIPIAIKLEDIIPGKNVNFWYKPLDCYLYYTDMCQNTMDNIDMYHIDNYKNHLKTLTGLEKKLMSVYGIISIFIIFGHKDKSDLLEFIREKNVDLFENFEIAGTYYIFEYLNTSIDIDRLRKLTFICEKFYRIFLSYEETCYENVDFPLFLDVWMEKLGKDKQEFYEFQRVENENKKTLMTSSQQISTFKNFIESVLKNEINFIVDQLVLYNFVSY